MKNEWVAHIKNNPAYQELVEKRSRLGWLLSIFMAVVYFGFVLTIAFDPKSLAYPLYEGSVTTVGIALGIGIILCAFVLTGVYVYRANAEFDELTAKIKADLEANS